LNDVYLCGVIEGFYGRVWPWTERHALIEFLAAQQFNTYVYAPKADRQLRRDWRSEHEAGEFDRLLALRERCRQQGIRFGIGLAPWGLQADYTAADRAALRNKFAQLNRLDTDLLCILFDDMPGNFAQLASRQLAIVEDIAVLSNARRFVMCPTYYSFDPVLEQLFGPMPVNYLEDIGRGLGAQIDVFWTGSHVLAPGFTRADIDAIAARIDRKPLLWDNYPVNDGRKSSRFLHLLPVVNRPAGLRDWCAGHLANPMNQPRLSRLPLASLALSYRLADGYDPAAIWCRQLQDMDSPALARLIGRDADLFQRTGLDVLDPDRRASLIAEYRALPDAAAIEIADWLDEGYRFDPECLND
jgi:hypothetical protein